MIIQTRVDTIVKTRLPLQNEQLRTTEKFSIRAGSTFEVKRLTPEKNQYLIVEFSNPFPFFQAKPGEILQQYIYAPHWIYPDEKVVLPASYYWQINNPSGDGARECCGTSNAIMLNYLLNGKLDRQAASLGVEQPESIYLDRLALYGDTTDHDANTKALLDFGIDSFWSTSLTLADLYLSLRNSIPFVMGLDYTVAGHIVCGVGFNLKAETLIIHDPNGARAGASNDWISKLPEAGKFDTYNLDTLCRLWFPQNQEGSQSLGWGRIVTHINGKPTIFAH